MPPTPPLPPISAPPTPPAPPIPPTSAPLKQSPVSTGNPPAAMAALATALTAKLDQLAQGQAALAPRVDALEPRLGNLEAAQRRADTAIAATTQRAQGYGRLQAAAVALEAGQKLGTIPNAPPALTRFAQVAPPTQATLRQTFPAAANAARRASRPSTPASAFMNRMWDRAQRSVTVRQGDSILMGDPINGILAHARQALEGPNGTS